MTATSIELLASSIAARGQSRVVRLDDRAACGLHAGADTLNPKEWACEDAVGLHRLDDGSYLAAVADSHFGGRAADGVISALRDAWEREGGSPPLTRLYRALLDVEEAYLDDLHAEERSETTVLLAHLTGRRVSYLSVGDSLLLVVGPGGDWRLVNRRTPAFFGRTSLLDQAGAPEETGIVDLDPSAVVLLATDGIETPYSGMDPKRIGEILLADDPVDQRLRRLLDEAADPSRGGGKDNLGAVVLLPE